MLTHRQERILCAVTGTAAATLQPAAGAAGELTGLLLMRAWHESRGRTPTKVLIPDSAHGTNPASVTMAGYEAVEVPSDGQLTYTWSFGEPGGGHPTQIIGEVTLVR